MYTILLLRIVMILYPLATMQMYQQCKYGKVPYAVSDTMEMGIENNAAANLDVPPPSYEKAREHGEKSQAQIHDSDML